MLALVYLLPCGTSHPLLTVHPHRWAAKYDMLLPCAAFYSAVALHLWFGGNLRETPHIVWCMRPFCCKGAIVSFRFDEVIFLPAFTLGRGISPPFIGSAPVV